MMLLKVYFCVSFKNVPAGQCSQALPARAPAGGSSKARAKCNCMWVTGSDLVSTLTGKTLRRSFTADLLALVLVAAAMLTQLFNPVYSVRRGKVALFSG